MPIKAFLRKTSSQINFDLINLNVFFEIFANGRKGRNITLFVKEFENSEIEVI